MTHQPPSTEVPLLSVVIRNRNEAAYLGQVLDALAAQDVQFPHEVILVDNESEDDSRQVAGAHGARVITISRQDFTYGRALNAGLTVARGQFVLTLSAHSLPVGRHFLQDCIAPFSDPQIVAARCLSTADGPNLSLWYQPRVIHYANSAEQRQAEAGKGWLKTYPTAACSVIRRSVWEEVKYDESLEAVEDKEWASRVLARGYKIVNSTECVFHYLKIFDEDSLWQKQRSELLALYRISGEPPLTLKWFIIRMLRAFYDAPCIAFRHLHRQFQKNYDLVSIPAMAKKTPRLGSLHEFERERNVRD